MPEGDPKLQLATRLSEAARMLRVETVEGKVEAVTSQILETLAALAQQHQWRRNERKPLPVDILREVGVLAFEDLDLSKPSECQPTAVLVWNAAGHLDGDGRSNKHTITLFRTSPPPLRARLPVLEQLSPRWLAGYGVDVAQTTGIGQTDLQFTPSELERRFGSVSPQGRVVIGATLTPLR